jgi:hypothetical protein
VTLREIAERFGQLGIYEKRALADDYGEFVFYNKEGQAWYDIFTEILGPAKKPPGVKPAKEDLELTKDYGGIYPNQTLFKREFDGTTVVAMFWPWQDKEHTTLKMILFRK